MKTIIFPDRNSPIIINWELVRVVRQEANDANKWYFRVYFGSTKENDYWYSQVYPKVEFDMMYQRIVHFLGDSTKLVLDLTQEETLGFKHTSRVLEIA